ncbi:hypothetical protein MHYP_G00106940 [Metynnis hypsauchen]
MASDIYIETPAAAEVGKERAELNRTMSVLQGKGEARRVAAHTASQPQQTTDHSELIYLITVKTNLVQVTFK